MAFGFLKKNETADIIFFNGHIYTQDPDLPLCDAVACKGEEIVCTGSFESMDEYKGKNTQCIDLQGKYLFPGFIDMNHSPVMKVFEDTYLDLTHCTSTEEVLEEVSAFAEENPDLEVVFGYGYNEKLKPEDNPQDNQDEELLSSSTLSTACSDRPVLLLCESSLECWTNTVADKIIVDTAEEEVVEVITVSYVLNLLIPFNFDIIEQKVKHEIEELCDRGVTSVLSLQAPDYFENLYRDSLIGLYNEGDIKQRFFGTYFMNRPLIPNGLLYKLMTRKTTCIEMNGQINADMLYVYLDTENCPLEFSQNALDTIFTEVFDKGFSIFVEAISEKDLLMTYNALEAARSKSYKNILIIASDNELSDEEKNDLMYWDSAYTIWKTDLNNENILFENSSSSQEALELLTTNAAAMLGMSKQLGMVSKGYLADFAIFEENPLEKNLNVFSKMHAEMTVLGGKIVYDAQNAADDELMNMMFTQQY